MSRFDQKNKLKELFKAAAEIASEVPESMQSAAFTQAVELLFESESGSPKQTVKHKTKRKIKSSEEQTDDARQTLLDAIDRTKYPVTDKLSVRHRALYVLSAAREDCDLDGLTTSEIANVLSNKFRVPTTANAVNMALSKAGSLVDRKRKGTGSGYEYRIMVAGEKELEDLAADESAGSKKAGSQKKKSAKKKAKSRAANKKKSSNTAKKTGSSGKKKPRSGRPGPKSAIEGLISKGFFESPRTIPAIAEQLRHGTGYIYKITDLSPALVRLVRAEHLLRTQNNDGQYEYFKDK